MRQVSGVVIAAVLLALGPVLAADAGDGGARPALALVAQLDGSATLTAAGSTRPLQLFTRLGAGDRVEVGVDGAVVVAMLTGERFRVPAGAWAELSADGAIKGSTLEPLPQVATVPALAAIPPGEAPGPRSGAIRVRSGSLWGAEVEDLYPRDGAAAAADQAVLAFRSVVNTESYRVDVEDEMGETVFQVETRSPEVVIPAGVLEPGTEYYWRVRGSGRRSLSGRGEALFVTLAPADAEALEALRSAAEADGSVSALLLLAEAERSLGLYREACAVLDRVGGKAPENQHVVAAREVFACAEYGGR